MAGTDFEPKKSGAAKKWLIGCGGCLVVVVIVVVAAVILGRSAFEGLMQTSNNTVKEILGESYQSPSGVTAIGIPAGQGPVRKMAMLIEPASGQISFVLSANVPEEELAQLQKGDKAKAEEIIKRLGVLLQGNSSSSKLDLSSMRFDETKMAKLPNGKTFPLSLAMVKASSSKGTVYTPTAVALIPQTAGEMVMVLTMNGEHGAREAGADLSASEKMLETQMINLVSASELDDRLR